MPADQSECASLAEHCSASWLDYIRMLKVYGEYEGYAKAAVKDSKLKDLRENLVEAANNLKSMLVAFKIPVDENSFGVLVQKMQSTGSLDDTAVATCLNCLKLDGLGYFGALATITKEQVPTSSVGKNLPNPFMSSSNGLAESSNYIVVFNDLHFRKSSASPSDSMAFP